MRHELVSESEDFHFRVFDCIDLALSTLGEYQKSLVLHVLEDKYRLSGREIAAEPTRLEEALKDLLGVSVAAFVIVHILDNISSAFGIEVKVETSIEEAIQSARTKKEGLAIRVNVR